jgi:RND family efflux transporter MFP subunit
LRPVAVLVAPVEVGEISDIRYYTGTLAPSRRFMVAPKVSGLLIELNADVGQALKNGQVVGRLESAEYQEEVAQAQAELEVARAGLDEARTAQTLARQALERVETLRSRDFVSEVNREQAQADLATSEARVNVAEAVVRLRESALRRANIRLDYTTIRSTWEGDNETRFVSQRYLDEGTTVNANQAVIEVVSLDRLVGQVYVSEEDYYRINPGLPVVVTVAGQPREKFQGEVARLAPAFSDSSRRALIEIDVPNRRGLLKPGLFARFALELDTDDAGVLIPRNALVRRANREGVFVVNQETRTARFHPVTTLFSQDEILSVEGLDPGMLVVVLGQGQLVDGTPVAWERRGEPTAPPETRRGTRP